MRKVITTLFTILLFLLGEQYGYCQQDNSRFMRWAKEDPISMFKDVGSEQLLTAASFGMGITMISLADANISKNIQHHYARSPVLDFTNRWGEWQMVTSISAGIFGTSLLTNNTKLQDAAFTSLQSLVMTNLTVNAGKFLFARHRPLHRKSPHSLEFAELGATSFPSGHTATAFAFLTPWVIYYPSPVTYSLMAIPVGTAVARVAKGRHWLSDVTAGAAIGFSMAYYLSKKHLNIKSDRVRITPTAGRNSVALSFNLSF